MLPLLEQFFTIYAVDRRGSGDAKGYDLAREFEDIATVIDSIGGPVNVLGHALLPDSRIVVMPGQQHVATNTAPDLFLHEVLDFLREPD